MVRTILVHFASLVERFVIKFNSWASKKCPLVERFGLNLSFPDQFRPILNLIMMLILVGGGY